MMIAYRKCWVAILMITVGIPFRPCASGGTAKKVYSYTGMNGEQHEIEGYFPAIHTDASTAPCFIFFHGGGWQGGNLDAGRPFCEYLASRGMVALTANYSMHPKPKDGETPLDLPNGESKKRICVMDGKTVVRWAKQHAGELGIDPGKVAVGGASAGGHISVLQMLDREFNNPADPKGVNTDVQAFVLLCPAFTVPERDACPDVNVFNHLGKKIPPTLFIVGATDPWKQASDVLVEKLAEKKNDFEVWMGPGVGHMFFRTEDWMTQTLIKIDVFLTANGFLEGKTTLQPAENGRKLECIKALGVSNNKQ